MTNPSPPQPSTAALVAAGAYFHKGRCSGHAQFNGRYCRDAAGPDQWCIHCAGYMLVLDLSARTQALADLREALTAITEDAVGERRDPLWIVQRDLIVAGMRALRSAASHVLPSPEGPEVPGLKSGDVADWKDAALILGESLASAGPNGYYGFTPQQWLDWARQMTRR